MEFRTIFDNEKMLWNVEIFFKILRDFLDFLVNVKICSRLLSNPVSWAVSLENTVIVEGQRTCQGWFVPLTAVANQSGSFLNEPRAPFPAGGSTTHVTLASSRFLIRFKAFFLTAHLPICV